MGAPGLGPACSLSVRLCGGHCPASVGGQHLVALGLGDIPVHCWVREACDKPVPMSKGISAS